MLIIEFHTGWRASLVYVGVMTVSSAFLTLIASLIVRDDRDHDNDALQYLP